MDSRTLSSLSPRTLLRERELAQARRLGRWETAEDRLLVRQHEARQLLTTAGRNGAIGLLVVAWFVPLLWPFALLGSLRMFPRTTRRLALGVLASGALSLVLLSLLVGQLTRPFLPTADPALPPAAPAQRFSDPAQPFTVPAQPPASLRSRG